MTLSRRRFLRTSAVGMGGLMLKQSIFASKLMAATPQSGSYKALVCIDLDGGNDGNNVIVPLASQTYAQYSLARQQLAIAQADLLPVGDGHGAAYGFHPSLAGLRSMYLAGSAAIVANVGTLIAPLDRASFLAQSKPIPTALEDHEIQRQQWGTAYSATTPASPGHSGWGGRMADVMNASSSLGFPVLTSLIGADNFTAGDRTMPATVAVGNSAGFPADGSASDLQLIANLSSGSQLISAATAGLQNALQQSKLLNYALASATPFKTVFPTTSIGAQLQQVATIMSVQTALGMSRQIFLCRQWGFDLHGLQLDSHASLLSDFDQAVTAFTQCMAELGLANDVTLFTQSDFGRSLAMNSSAGSDHAWGNHQIVVGGAVKGDQIFGTFPDLTLAGPDDLESTGRWIPSSSIEQYAAPLASWFGVPDSELGQVFPNISAFVPDSIKLFG